MLSKENGERKFYGIPLLKNLLNGGLVREYLGVHTFMHIYRYTSLIITSLFYLAGFNAVTGYTKLAVLSALFLEATLFIYFYKRSSLRLQKALILIELVGALALLSFTSGLESCFLWYALNPILLSTTLASLHFPWLAASALIMALLFLRDAGISRPVFNSILAGDQANLILAFSLIILSVQISSLLIQKLIRQSIILEKQLRHVKSLYEAVEVFSCHRDPQEVANIFASYCRALTGAEKAIIWAREPGSDGIQDRLIFAVKGPYNTLSEVKWYPYVKNLFEDITKPWKIDYKYFDPQVIRGPGALVSVRIKSNTCIFGLLSAYFKEIEGVKKQEIEKTLIFLSDLFAASIEKCRLETLTERILISEEKNRIARQIHDTVNQDLFGLIHGLNSLKQKQVLPDAVVEMITLLQKTAHRSLQELRLSIYNLSDTRQRDTFAEELNNYCNDLQKLNNVAVAFTAEGDLTNLKRPAREALTRIIREATSNAIRHGDCRQLCIELAVEEKALFLSIRDDGKGFNPDNYVSGEHCGLGLLNMKGLAHSLGGELLISSAKNCGTLVEFRTVRQADKKEMQLEEALMI